MSLRVLFDQFEVKVYQLVEAFEHEFAMFVYSTKRKGCPLKDLKGFSTEQIIDEGDQGYIHLSYKI